MMRIIKDADVRKAEILDVAEALFNRKGYDATSISDIIEQVGVARATVYYHFKSKEDVLDALLERTTTEFLAAAKEIARDKSIPVFERLFQTLMAMNADKGNAEIMEMVEHIHKPQNALMHQKTHRLMMEGIPPILMEIVEDGTAEGLFNTPYPYESLEMIVAHINAVFGEYADSYTPEELLSRINAFVFNLERLFGSEEGSFGFVKKLFGIENGEQTSAQPAQLAQTTQPAQPTEKEATPCTAN
jgi:AcrR family transcriptional regulator